MNLCEHESKSLLASAGVTVPRGKLAATASEASCHAGELGPKVAVKAQIATGGRGRAGGVEVVCGRAAAYAAAQRILGMELKGHRVREVLVEEAVEVQAEFYAAFMLDRSAKAVTAMFSAQGGMAIEDVVRAHPEALARLTVPPLLGWQDFMARRLWASLVLDRSLLGPITDVLARLWQVYDTWDATLVEVNPLVIDGRGELIALDAKVTIDDGAFSARPERYGFVRGHREEDAEELARSKGLTYLRLEGTVGIMGNGAGLVMSTLDAVAAAGGAPANFLDLGGGATAERIGAALEAVTSNQAVGSVLCNVFGGITRCDEVARGLAHAVPALGVRLPVIVRLEGTNASQGRRLLEDAALPNVEVIASMRDAASRAVAICGMGLLETRG